MSKSGHKKRDPSQRVHAVTWKDIFLGFLPLFFVIGVLVLAISASVAHESHKEQKFLEDFNALVPVSMQQETISNICSIIDGPGMSSLTAEDCAFLWLFKEKYNVEAFPPVPENIHYSGTYMQEFVAQLRTVDAYAKTFDISDEAMSDILEWAFYVKQADLLTLIEMR